MKSKRRVEVILDHLVCIPGKSEDNSVDYLNISKYFTFYHPKLKYNLKSVSDSDSLENTNNNDKCVLYYHGEILIKNSSNFAQILQSKLFKFFLNQKKEIQVVLKDDSELNLKEYMYNNHFEFFIFDVNIKTIDIPHFKTDFGCENFMGVVNSNSLFSKFLSAPVECFSEFILKEECNLSGFYFLNDSDLENLRNWLTTKLTEILIQNEEFKKFHGSVIMDMYCFGLLYCISNGSDSMVYSHPSIPNVSMKKVKNQLKSEYLKNFKLKKK
jgi:hypothetical protein